MAALIVAGITLKAVVPAQQEEGEAIGESTRAFGGNLRSGVRAEKRRWTFTIYFPILSDEVALRAAVVNRAIVACSGTILGGSVNCEVVVNRTEWRKKTPTTLWGTSSITLREA